MPQSETPPDFAALWQAWQAARALNQSTEKPYFVKLAAREIDAARALIDALADDRILHRLNADCLAAMEATTHAVESHASAEVARMAFISEAIQARQALFRVRRMGLLHGPEEVGDGE